MATTLDKLDDAVQHEARRRILDTLGCALQAEFVPTLRAIRGYDLSRTSDGECTIWGTTRRASVQTAALLNGVATRALDLNDAYFGESGLHPSDSIPGILAVSEATDSQWGEVLRSVIIAYESSIDLCDVLTLAEHGWDHVNLIGIGSCLGIAALKSMSAAEIESALAIAILPHAAMRQTRVGTISMWKDCAAADSVRHSVYACELAQAGVLGPNQPFEGRQALLAQLVRGTSSCAELVELVMASDRPSRISDSHMKVWPLGYVAQAAVEAAESLRRRVPSDEIRDVSIFTYGAAVQIMCDDEKWRPTTRGTADHSLPYVVAEMLLRGAVDEASFEPERFLHPETIEFMNTRMTVEESEGLSRRYPNEFPVRVEARLFDGRVVVEEVAVPMGHALRPLSDGQVSDKFHAGADSILGRDRASCVEDMVMSCPSELRISREVLGLTTPDVRVSA